MKVLLPNSVELALAGDDEFVIYDIAEPIPVEHEDADVLVVWANPAALLQDAADRLKTVRWVQTLAAGADAVVQAGFADDVPITSGVTLHDRPVAEHALALVLAAVRRLHLASRAQGEHRWARELGGVQLEHDPAVLTTLRGARVLVWGYGGIARTVAPLLTALGATVTGVARSRRVDKGVPVISVGEIESELPNTDVLLMILPATVETAGALNAERLALLSRRSWVINVGRGSTVDQDALVSALREGRLGGAALDVTSPEPLPETSALWDLPNVILTPHAAGGRPLGAARLIEENLGLLRRGEALRNLVER